MKVACADTKGRLDQFSTHGLPDCLSATETKLTALKYIELFYRGVITDRQRPNKSAIPTQYKISTIKVLDWIGFYLLLNYRLMPILNMSEPKTVW